MKAYCNIWCSDESITEYAKRIRWYTLSSTTRIFCRSKKLKNFRQAQQIGFPNWFYIDVEVMTLQNKNKTNKEDINMSETFNKATLNHSTKMRKKEKWKKFRSLQNLKQGGCMIMTVLTQSYSCKRRDDIQIQSFEHDTTETNKQRREISAADENNNNS